MENEPKNENIERIVVDTIENGYTVTIQTEEDEKTYAFPSYRLVLKHLKEITKEQK